MMKFVCILFFVVANTLAHEEKTGDEMSKMIQIFHDKCKKQAGTDEDHIKRLIEGHFDEDPHMAEYVKCLLHDTKAIKDNGEPNAEVIGKLIPPSMKDEALLLYSECFKKNEGFPYGMAKCVFDSDPKKYIMF